MENNSLYHHGIKGQRWGVRRFQKKNGALTAAGRKRYAKNAKNSEPEKPKELTLEEKKAKVLASRSAKTLYENRKMFNYDEMSKAKQLLEVDKQVKDMIVKEPGKVAKFFDDAVIPWSKRISDFATNSVKIIKELEKIVPEDSAPNNGKPKNSTPKNSKPNDGTPKTKPENKSNPSDDTDRKGGGVKGTPWGDRDKSKKAAAKSEPIYDVDWKDITPSPETVSFVSGLLDVASVVSSNVSSLPVPSSETRAFFTENISGYLPGPKEDY